MQLVDMGLEEELPIVYFNSFFSVDTKLLNMGIDLEMFVMRCVDHICSLHHYWLFCGYRTNKQLIELTYAGRKHLPWRLLRLAAENLCGIPQFVCGFYFLRAPPQVKVFP